MAWWPLALVQAAAQYQRSGLRRIDRLFYVGDLVTELNAHQELWDDFDLRTNHPKSPHRELSDIFVRYNARENFTGDRNAFNESHDAVWWPAADKLPSARRLALDLMNHVQGERLGMVLITKIPAHSECYPHIDLGWHARHHDKYAIQLASNLQQSFHVENESLSALPGECYYFDNSRPHWVKNDSDEDRMTMIVCIRNRFTGAR